MLIIHNIYCISSYIILLYTYNTIKVKIGGDYINNILKLNNTSITLNDLVSMLLFFNNNYLYKYKNINNLDIFFEELTLSKSLKEHSEKILKEIYCKNIDISPNIYFYILNLLINTKENKNSYKLFNDYIDFEYFSKVLSNLNKDLFNKIKHQLLFLDKEEILKLENTLEPDKNTEFTLNKFYQVFITFILNKYNTILDTSKLIKNYDFNTVFLNKNYKYFDKVEIALYQKNKCKSVDNTLKLIKNEILSLIDLKDIDENIFNEYLKYIFNKSFNLKGRQSGYEVFYFFSNKQYEIDRLINSINKGFLDLDKFCFKSSLLNKYILNDLNIEREHLINHINDKSDFFPLYGLYGSYDIEKIHSKKTIIKNKELLTQTIFTIIKEIKKDNKQINVISFLILDPISKK